MNPLMSIPHKTPGLFKLGDQVRASMVGPVWSAKSLKITATLATRAAGCIRFGGKSKMNRNSLRVKTNWNPLPNKIPSIHRGKQRCRSARV